LFNFISHFKPRILPLKTETAKGNPKIMTAQVKKPATNSKFQYLFDAKNNKLICVTKSNQKPTKETDCKSEINFREIAEKSFDKYCKM